MSELANRRSAGRPLTPASTALIIVDLQRCFVDRSSKFAATGASELIQRLNELAVRCREVGALVVFTAHVLRSDHSNAGTLVDKVPAVMRGMIDETSPNALLDPAVHVEPSDVVVRKPRFSAFAGTDLDLILRTRGVDTILIGGIATDICCESTARDASDRGLNVFFLSDGTATGSGPDDPEADGAHAAAIARLDAYFANVVRTADLRFGAPSSS